MACTVQCQVTKQAVVCLLYSEIVRILQSLSFFFFCVMSKMLVYLIFPSQGYVEVLTPEWHTQNSTTHHTQQRPSLQIDFCPCILTTATSAGKKGKSAFKQTNRCRSDICLWQGIGTSKFNYVRLSVFSREGWHGPSINRPSVWLTKLLPTLYVAMSCARTLPGIIKNQFFRLQYIKKTWLLILKFKHRVKYGCQK